MLLDSGLQFGGVKVKRSPSSMIDNASIDSYEIEPSGPGSIRLIYGIIHFIYIGTNAILQSLFTFPGDGTAFLDRLGVNHICGRSHPR